MTKRVIQDHHIIYSHSDHPSQKEVKATIFKGEHFIIGRINFFTKNTVSKGFIKCLKVFVALNEDRAIDLEALSRDELEKI